MTAVEEILQVRALAEARTRMWERLLRSWIDSSPRGKDLAECLSRQILLHERRIQQQEEVVGDPDTPAWPIWVEGYVITGDSGRALFVGVAHGYTFTNAVRAWYAAHPDPANFNSDRLTHWGRNHYPTEAEARVFNG